MDIQIIAKATGGIAVAAPAYRPKKQVSAFKKKFNRTGLRQLHDITVIGIEAAEKSEPRAPVQNRSFMAYMRELWTTRKSESGSSDTVPEGEASFNDIAEVFLDAYTKADLAKPVGDGDDDNTRPGRLPNYKFLDHKFYREDVDAMRKRRNQGYKIK